MLQQLFLLVLLFITSDALSDLKDIHALGKNSTVIKNEHRLLEKLNKLIEDGSTRLQIVSDFDNTLTADNGVHGKLVLNSFEMFRKCPSVPQWYKDEEYKLYIRYKPVENDPNLSTEEKSNLLIDWYRAASNLMKGIKFPRQELKDVAYTARECFRDNIHKLLSWTDNKNVPILVLSSGLGEAVIDTLEAANLSSPHMKVIANFLELNSDDTIIGMKGDPIHSFNKDKAFKKSGYYEQLSERKNVILMGDTIGDASMVNEFDNADTVIKIGYLSTKRQARLTEYLNHFDIVLQNDQTMAVINDLVNLL